MLEVECCRGGRGVVLKGLTISCGGSRLDGGGGGMRRLSFCELDSGCGRPVPTVVALHSDDMVGSILVSSCCHSSSVMPKSSELKEGHWSDDGGRDIRSCSWLPSSSRASWVLLSRKLSKSEMFADSFAPTVPLSRA